MPIEGNLILFYEFTEMVVALVSIKTQAIPSINSQPNTGRFSYFPPGPSNVEIIPSINVQVFPRIKCTDTGSHKCKVILGSVIPPINIKVIPPINVLVGVTHQAIL